MAGMVPYEATDDGGGFVDPAVFITSNKTHHDCILTVTDPDTKNVEKIGTPSYHLISQSSVFRKRLLEEENGLKKIIEVNDVSPEVLKLMLTYIYGGKLPEIDRATRAQLALAARSYDLRYLEENCCEKLVPTTVDEVFPALVCVAHLNNTILLPDVTKIVQEKTDELVAHSDFLKLDVKCMDFIASQDKLAVVEVELWKALVKWSTDRAGKDSKKTARDFLSSTLQFVRFATMTQDQIIKQVIPCKILSDNEVVSLISTVSSGTAFDCIGLCNTTKVRCIPVKKISNASVPVQKDKPPTKIISNKTFILDSFKYLSLREKTLKTFTYIKIQPTNPVELQSLWVTGLDAPNDSITSTYPIKYCIAVKEFKDGLTGTTLLNISKVSKTVAFGEVMALSLLNDFGDGLLLDEKCYYNVELCFSEPHPAFTYYNSSQQYASLFNLVGLSIYFKGQTHVRKIAYKV